MKQAERWYVIYYRYLRNSVVPLEVIYFEKLVTDLELAMRKIVNYLDVEIVDFDEVNHLFKLDNFHNNFISK